MKYIFRKILSAILPAVIIGSFAHGLICGFVNTHYCIIAFSAVLLILIYLGRFIRKIIYFPFRLIRKVLFRF